MVAASGNTLQRAAGSLLHVYQHGFQNLDRHVWGVFQMNPIQGD
jgi:hypothetical protein